MGIEVQKSALPTLFHFGRVRTASQPHVRPQRNVINFLGLVAETYIKNGSSGVEGGLVLVQSHKDEDVWIFGYVEGDYDGLLLVENAQPHSFCREDTLKVSFNEIFTESEMPSLQRCLSIFSSKIYL